MKQCIVCEKELVGKQEKFCSIRCRSKKSNKIHQIYEKQKERGDTRMILLMNSLGGKCKICGYDKNSAALCFHHRNPSIKSFGLSLRECSNRSWEVLEKEASKCDLLCSNCHMEIHHPRLTKKVGVEGFEPPTQQL